MAKIIPWKSMRERVVTMPFYPSKEPLCGEYALSRRLFFWLLSFTPSPLLKHRRSLCLLQNSRPLIPPNDAGDSISLTWSTSPSDAPDVFYVVYIDKDKDGAFTAEAARIPSNSGYRTGVPEIYGYKKGMATIITFKSFPKRFSMMKHLTGGRPIILN